MSEIENIDNTTSKIENNVLNDTLKRLGIFCSNLVKAKKKTDCLGSLSEINKLNISNNVRIELIAMFDSELEKNNYKSN
jgi:hypothetical protein